MISHYRADMDLLTPLHPGVFIAWCASQAAPQQSSVLIAELALRSPLTILDGGNRFQAYRVAQLLRQHTTDITTTAKRIFIRRAFTCYQMLALLEGTPALRQPYLLLDPLATFYDDHVTLQEARRLLEQCLRQVERLRQFAPVVLTLAPPPVPERACLVELVCSRAGRVFRPEIPTPSETQLALFPDLYAPVSTL